MRETKPLILFGRKSNWLRIFATLFGLALALFYGGDLGTAQSTQKPDRTISNSVVTTLTMPAKVDPSTLNLQHQEFTFVRIKHRTTESNNPTQPYYFNRKWNIDYPDADLGLTARVAEELDLPIDPDGKVIELTDASLSQFPFIYMAEPGHLRLSPEERKALRQYLLSGGFLMADDFWGTTEWEHFRKEMGHVFPDRAPVELPLSHAVFNCYFHIKAKPQVPSVAIGIASQSNGGITWEREDAKEPHYRGLFDDAGRLMAIFCHNTDLGDCWERCGVSEYYQREFCEKRATPMGINIVVYALSH